ncbi:MAG TPA: dihydropteroate synthase [Mesotoga infera]|jgi:dihydropteroate synthase|nr:dihydropteroate synthase [Mesotoga sp.]NLI07469.1 dihydropteroate synthase [Thermotogaceae bacterium]HNR79486.1 dihydropteroate synthase [Mesotoga infera]HNS66223.1 dihydropteroate synthase [Mesotoga infera]HOI34991.1 dihydropteroate synthase [Mesotoga infera]
MDFRNGRTLDLSSPVIMGIINTTPDSFYPGSRVPDTRTAVKRAMEMLDSGASIIDIGGESSRPGAEAIDWQEEVRRVVPVVRGIRELRPEAIISVDTYNRNTALQALSEGADIVNDITGLIDPAMIEVVAKNEAAVIIMHMKGTPSTMNQLTNYSDVVSQVKEQLLERCEKAVAGGVREEAIILDPGIGFAKNALQSLEILRKITDFTCLKYPVLVGHSRKSFIGYVSGLPVEERLEETLAVSTYLYMKGVKILRVHDVEEHRRIFDILKLIDKSTG